MLLCGGLIIHLSPFVPGPGRQLALHGRHSWPQRSDMLPQSLRGSVHAAEWQHALFRPHTTSSRLD